MLIVPRDRARLAFTRCRDSLSHVRVSMLLRRRPESDDLTEVVEVRSRRSLASLGAIVGLMVGACTGPGSTPSPSVVPAVSRTETVEQAGVLLTLTLDRTTVETSGVIHARATVRNLGPGPITWADLGSCDVYLFDREAPDVAQPPPGISWSGTLGLVKDRSILPLGAKGFLPPAVLVGDGSFTCSEDDRRPAELPERGSMSLDMVWQALMGHRLPAPAGEYRAIFQFPFLGRISADQFTGDLGSDMSWIRVGVPFEVVGEAFSGIAPTLAVDRALEDGRVSTWLLAHDPHDIRRAGIVLVGDRWLFIVDTRRGELRVEIRATDGAILGVDIQG